MHEDIQASIKDDVYLTFLKLTESYPSMQVSLG